MLRPSFLAIAALLIAVSLPGCHVDYCTPGPAAELSLFGGPATTKDALTDPAIRQVLVKEPLASFPAGLAVARVQGSGYSNFCIGSYGSGRYSVVTTRDVETDKDYERIGKMPMVKSVAPISRLLLPQDLQSSAELRRAAAALGADMLLVYTFDTQYKTDDYALPLKVVTLGLFPTDTVDVSTTVSAVLLDVRNGFVYGSVEASAKKAGLGNAWTSDRAADGARQRAERQALDGLLESLEKTWPQIVRTYDVPRVYREQDASIWSDHWDHVEPGQTHVPEGKRYRTAP